MPPANTTAVNIGPDVGSPTTSPRPLTRVDGDRDRRRSNRRPRRSRWRTMLIAWSMCGLAATGCASTEREYAGAQIAPPPMVGEQSLPELTNDGAPRRFVADPASLLIVYFGYTNCPDFCPTSLSDLASARNRLSTPERIRVAMVTVDPDRDLATLPQYVRSFFSDGIALGTDDPARLAAAAAPFGVSFSITPAASSTSTGPTASTPDPATDDATAPKATTPATGEQSVSHTTNLYAVDDTGHLVLTWTYGTAVSDIAADIEQFLATERPATEP